MKYTDLYTAYANYLIAHYSDKFKLSRQLQLDAWHEPDSIVWKWLEMTGDKKYTSNTFMKVAERLIEESTK
jgi:hypothetical protein